MSAPAQSPPVDVPESGWMIDLTDQQRQSLIGAHVRVTCGAKQAAGVLVKVTTVAAHVFLHELAETVEFNMAATAYRRVAGTPMRPALARAVVYQNDWDTTRARLIDDHGIAVDRAAYDQALAAHEQGLGPVYDELLLEASRLLRDTSRTETDKENAA